MRSTRLVFLLLCICSSLLGQVKRPNVLFIAVDDLRPDLSCFGESQSISPTIDRLASEGVVFTRAYCQYAVCSPSRISIMTGVHPDRTGIYGGNPNNKIEWRDIRPGLSSIPQQFRDHGYYSIGFGKIFDVRVGIDMEHSWDAFTQGWGGLYKSPRSKELLALAEEQIAAGIEPDIIKPAVDYYDTSDDTYPDGQNTAHAVSFIESYEGDKPYFLAVGFMRPHLPFVAPKKYWDLYERDSILLPKYPNVPEGITAYTISTYKEIEDYINRSIINEEKTRELRHGYLACISYIDAQLGKIINALQEKDELNNTVILLWGDHGFKLGDFGEWAKHSNLETDTRVPLLLRLPNKFGANTKISALVELVDVMPTLCNAARIPIPETAEGHSLLKILCSPELELRDFALSQYRRGGNIMGYSMRTKEWRYTEWINRDSREIVDQELYMLDNLELMEQKNVANENSDLVSQLSAMLREYIDSAPRWEGKAFP